ncbi:MAG: c-type cytochrome [Verrucomicrobiales bacterium]|nr:c-type cytochrome [Verrucomicrobiales bacterium]
MSYHDRLLVTGIGWAGILVSLGLVAFAEAEQFPEIFNSEQDKVTELTPAETAAGLIKLPEGFMATLFASEPEVQNPVAMAWDRRGRLWIAENYTYAEKAVRFEYSLRDRIIVLEDTDWDGKADVRTVFSEDLQVLTSLETGRGGVWALCPPQLLFIPDENGDDIPDREPEVVLDGFDLSLNSYHNFANGLRWGPDGWLYGRCGHSSPGRIGVPGTPDKERIPIKGGMWRFHPERKVFEGITHGTTNPWGHDWDAKGELFFINTVNGHLWHGIPGAHFPESFGADPNPYVFERIDTHADHYHYDRRGKWSDSRDGAADGFGGGHAHVGMMIYQGTAWPERFHDRLFTINMHGRRTNVERLDRVGSGFVGRHEPDIFHSGDEWFRGLDIRPGPDGSVFLIDWSDIGECHEHTGVHRTSGRIYRISFGMPAKPLFPQDPHEWLFNEKPWYAQAMRRDLTVLERDALVAALETEGAAVPRLRAMWALHRNQEDPVFWTNFLSDPEESVRTWAIRLILDSQPIDTIVGPLAGKTPEPQSGQVIDEFVRMARDDESGLVRLALASGLQRLPLEQRGDVALALAARREDADDHNLPYMVWYGISPLVEIDPDSLIAIAGATNWTPLVRWISRSLVGGILENPEEIEKLLSAAASYPGEMRVAVLEGMSNGLQGWAKAPEPKGWDAFTENPVAVENGQLVRELNVLFGDGRALEEIKALVLDREADHGMRSAALNTLIEARPEGLRQICSSLLSDRSLNAIAVKGLALFDDPALGRSLAKQYRRFQPDDREEVISVLVSRPAWAEALLREIQSEAIPKGDLSAFQARRIEAFNSESLSTLLRGAWGSVRKSDEGKEKLIKEWTEKLTPEVLNEGDLHLGRQLFSGICGACHLMYGEGGEIGPDLTGSGRSDISYLLENIFDPDSVVSSEYQISTMVLKDGRVLTGIVSGETGKTVTVRQATDEITLEKSTIVSREVSPVSMMPEGLLLALGEDQLRDLIAYLMHPVQVPLPAE